MRTIRLRRNRKNHGEHDGTVRTRGVGTFATRVTKQKRELLYVKVEPRREPITLQWIDQLHLDLREEFGRLRNAGVKFQQRFSKFFGIRYSHGEQ